MKTFTKQQLLPIILTILTFFALSYLLYYFLVLLNLFPAKAKITLVLRPIDMLIGLTIYLKTSIDFAIFIGNLMHNNPGWKNRIAIEIGTALGNFLGTIIILTIWTFFKEIPILLIIMIILASLVLLQMAEEGFEDFLSSKTKGLTRTIAFSCHKLIAAINKFFKPLIGKIIPERITNTKALSLPRLLLFSVSIPLLLGLDDFAGYIPLFSIINIFGFAIGVFLAHTILNITLFLSPNLTTKIVKNAFVVVLGSLVFVGLAFLGIFEAIQLVKTIF